MNFDFILGATIVLEIFTIYLRFGLGLTSKHVQKHVGFPVRVHPMYIGLVTVVVGLFYSPILVLETVGAVTLLDLGIAITLSDLAHHFIVLPSFQKEMDFP